MMQRAVNPWAFARPPPPGFGFSFARQPVADLPARRRPPPPGFEFSYARQPARRRPPPPGFEFSYARQPVARLRTPPPSIGFFCDQLPVDDVPARVLPPPPGFSRPCSKVLPPSPSEIPAEVPPKHPKRAAAPQVSTAVSENEKPSTTKRRRVCSDYEDDIDANLRRTERSPEERPRPDYLKTVQQDRVTPSDRARMIDWMDDFVRHHDLVDGTLHHAVAYVDRVLSVRAMRKHTDHELRLLGAVAIFVSAKYEDGQRTLAKLDPDKISWYVGGSTTREEVLDMERRMVVALGYQLGGPTAHTFVSRFTKHTQGEEELKIQRMAHRLTDESLRNYACLGYLPSVVASSAIFLARSALLNNLPDVPAWSSEMQELTGYDGTNLAGCLHAMRPVAHL
ncbi:cyclin-F2-2-like [Lolium rigidum]|uniref:cyclin-F2-2-like n=1 Tax=Lolium rigidum TaxID=89674 RepID=UPI001F5D8E84|nr:cyclin-F2-2-like [Lolium rigidum]